MSTLTDSSTVTQSVQDKPSLRELDKAFAKWLSDNFCQASADDDRGTLESLAKAVSYALHLKHTCLNLDEYPNLGDSILNEVLQGIEAGHVLALKGKPIDDTTSECTITPMVCSVDGQQIWMQKYYWFEHSVAKRIKSMSEGGETSLNDAQRGTLGKLYLDDGYKEQREAVKKALTHRFSVITGGPGTGKTYTAARVIAMMSRHGIDGRQRPRIALAAPTGKAANRVYQSLGKALGTPEVKEIIGDRDVPREATTLHTLLKVYRGSTKPRMNAANPLPVDVLIIDEASMIDLPMMHRVLEALPKDARLILLGDKDQLSSVEAGSVLAELCAPDTPDSPDRSYIATISESRRYKESPEIGALAKAINGLEIDKVPSLPDFEKNQYVKRNELSEGESTWNPEWLGEAETRLNKLGNQIKKEKRVSDILERQTDFQVLCALRKGPYGVSGINSMVEKKLGKKKDGWYSGCPVMILSNDHQRKIYNGDVGLVLHVRQDGEDWVIGDQDDKLRACFPVGGDTVKAISFAQMPAFETCYAMTVHKSQGSEYKKVLLVLPADKEAVEKNPVITKELVYTGVTRAREAVEIWCGKDVLETAVKKQTVRMSGLSTHLKNGQEAEI